MTLTRKFFIAAIISAFLSACAGGSSEEKSAPAIPPPTTTTKVAPIAVTGDDFSVDEDATVTLDGSNSSDSDGSITSYGWVQTSGSPTVEIQDSDKDIASFIAPDVNSDTQLVFELTVTDNDGKTHADSISIKIIRINQAPKAITAENMTVIENDTISIDGSNSNDPDGTISHYAWVQTSGANVSISNSTQSVASFTVPEVETDTELTFQLTVTDNDGASDSVDVNIAVQNIVVIQIPQNQAPQAVTANDFTIEENTSHNLDGSGSSDSDGTITTYSWLQTSGIDTPITNADQPIASITAPDVDEDTQLTFQLTVTDNGGESSSETITASILEKDVIINKPPIFTSGSMKIVFESRLDTEYRATASDPDNDTLTFSLTGGADKSVFEISALNGVLSFTTVTDYQNPIDANLDNRYEVEISVSDGFNDDVSKTVIIEVIPEVVVTPTSSSSMPIGIPDPGFGIDDEMPSRPSNWNNEVAGYYFVNNSTGSNSGNTYGTPSSPRYSIPRPIPAGSYIEIEGNYSNNSSISVQSKGTAGTWSANNSGAVWITGAKTGKSHAFLQKKLALTGSHLFVDGLTLHSGARITIGSEGSADHIVVRNTDVKGEFSDSAHDGTLI